MVLFIQLLAPRSVNVINTAPIKLLMGDIMDISKKLLALLVLFCVIASAGAACAADAYGDSGYDELGYADDIGEWVDSPYSDDNQTGWAGSQYNEDEQGGYAGSQYNETLENAAANAAAGEPVSDSVSQNMTANATSSHTMLETGNPILALLAVGAVLGSCAVLKRK